MLAGTLHGGRAPRREGVTTGGAASLGCEVRARAARPGACPTGIRAAVARTGARVDHHLEQGHLSPAVGDHHALAQITAQLADEMPWSGRVLTAGAHPDHPRRPASIPPLAPGSC